MSLLLRRRLCAAAAILTPSTPTTPILSHKKSRIALSLLRDKNPDPTRISSIVSAAALSPLYHIDRLALSAAVRSLTASSDFTSIRSLLSPYTLPHPHHAIVLFGQAGLLNDAIDAFRVSPSLRCFNSLLFSAILAKEYAEVTRIFRDFPSDHDITPDIESYNMVIESYSRSGATGSAYKLLEEMREANVKPIMTTYSSMLQGFYKEEKFDDVEKVVELIGEQTVAVYNVRIRCLCKMKRMGEAMGLFEEMGWEGVRANGVTYNYLVFGLCVAGKMEQAMELYREMVRKKLLKEGRYYFTLLYYLCRNGEFGMGLEVWKGALEKGWVPPFGTMKMLVSGLARIERVEEAKEVVEKVKEKLPESADKWKEVEEGFPQ